ncbi:WhiB family transcriptional regulator [Streptomyces sp. TRM66268-LWL]|uniref:WhiB family transcriptional regulator n=1 Tax=Streptomyces polyasparticus TaxID=2767826 RepID=A0ABR7SWE3_9ACTN|nr:WhiB family transcriptional regulator [Streptomyces polyasparticus]MBC9719718.1 WhiB family transcriptional regulator [Streptomyces polyasparticus]
MTDPTPITAAGTWRDHATCAQPAHATRQDLWYPAQLDTEVLRAARKVCMVCPVSAECLDDALAYEHGRGRDYRFGIRAGTTPGQRHHLAKQQRQQLQAAAA